MEDKASQQNKSAADKMDDPEKKDNNGTADEDELEKQRYNRKCCNIVAFVMAFILIAGLLILVIVMCMKNDQGEAKNEPNQDVRIEKQKLNKNGQFSFVQLSAIHV